MNDLGLTPEVITGLTGVVPNDYGLATSLYLSQLAKDYNIKLAESLGIDVSTPERYKAFVKSNPDAYKHAFLKHRFGYGLLNPTLGGMIQAHVIKNKLNRLQSMDSSENNTNGRFFDMFNEILQAYKTCEDKTSFLAGQVPEEVRPELLAALDAEDETKFNDLMDSVKGSEVVDEKAEEAIEPNESEIQIGDQPEVPDTTADAETESVAENTPVESITDNVTLPEGEIATLTDEQIETVTPTINEVASMTTQVQDLENLDDIPEDLKEGVEIWKDADEDFSVKIIAGTVQKLYKGDFSEAKDISEGEILRTGAEVAKELHDKGEHKTSLTKGIEEVHQDIKVLDLAELYSILGELKTLKDSVINFVDYIAEKDDLGLSPSKKKELAEAILDNGLFVDGTDKFREDVAEALNSAADYSAKDMSTRLDIFKDFSEGFEEHLSPLSDSACECIECVTEAEDKPEAEGEKVSEDAIDIAKNAGTVDKAIEMVEDRIEDLQKDDEIVEKFAQFSMDCAVQVAKDQGIDPHMYMSMLYGNSVQRTPYQQKVVDRILKREKALNRPAFLGGPGSARFDAKYGTLDNAGTQIAYAMPNVLGQAGKAMDQKYGTDVYGQVGSDIGEWVLANRLAEGKNKNQYFSCGDKSCGDGDMDAQTKIDNAKAKIEKANAKAYRRVMKGRKINGMQALALKNAGLFSESEKKDFAEGEAPVEEQISQEVIDNALSNNDQIRALVEKYKMLPTIEAKDQMKADMQTLGFTDDVIKMIEQYAEGNFSETEEAPVEEEVKAEETVTEETPAEEPAVDVASMVAPELFDSLLGPGVGETDPADGTLPVGEVEAPGTDIGHLGTFDQGIPAGEPVPEDDKEVTKVEIVNPEGDEFESIMR